MSYVVLARKWRPQSFDDLVGQEHVALTLANSIALDRVAHAFLFTGVRGVGKTTSARILAKALNCVHGPTAKPCLVCSACTEIAAGVDLDVLEIDGATYTGVNDIRQLQESLPYRPNRDRYKIYIVDEVHMLSNSAWNAFLKTLEEPPPHVKFIFATTEVQKVPVTILSRCQRYDFKLIGAQAIAARLRHVLDAEKIEAEDGALSILAREAAGSMRDAMSLLDQVIAWAGVGQSLTSEGVSKVLGVADRSMLHRLASALVAGDAADCVSIIGELAGQGYDTVHVARDFLAHLRDIVVAKVAPDARGLVDVADAELAEMKELAQKSDVEDLTRLHQGLSRSFDEIARSLVPRAALEMTLVRLARRPPLLAVDELLRRLGDLESRLSSGASHPSPGSGGSGGSSGSPGAGGPARGAPPRVEGRQGSAPAARSSAPLPSDPAEPPSVPPRGAEAAQIPRAMSADEAPPATQPSPFRAPPVAAGDASPFGPRNGSASPPATSSSVSSQPASGSPSAAEKAPASFGPSPTVTFAAPMPVYRGGPTQPQRFEAPSQGSAPRPVAPAHGAVTPPQNRGPVVAPLTPTELERLERFGAVVEEVRQQRSRLAPVLERAHVLEIGVEKLSLSFDAKSFESSQLAADPVALELVTEVARSVLGPAVLVEISEASMGAASVTLSRLYGELRRARRAALDESARSHPLVTAALEILGAELRDIKLPPEVDGAPVVLGADSGR